MEVPARERVQVGRLLGRSRAEKRTPWGCRLSKPLLPNRMQSGSAEAAEGKAELPTPRSHTHTRAHTQRGSFRPAPEYFKYKVEGPRG